MDIRPAGTNGRSLTHAFMTKWAAESNGADAVRIDLSRVSFIDTAGLALVAAAAQRAVFDERDVEFIPPADLDVARYASRMDLGARLSDLGIEARLPDVPHHDTGARLIELHQFDHTATDDLAERVHAAIRENGGSTHDANDFFVAISEVLSNVVDHSGAPSGFAAMQVMSGERMPDITFAVADVGVGIRFSLAARHDVKDDVDALTQAFEPGVSGKPDPRGMGLPDLYDRVKRRRGILRIWSGAAAGKSMPAGPLNCRAENTSFPGTIIYAALKPQSGEEDKS